MVSWWSDGDLSGYNAQYEQSMLAQYKLITPGMIDAQGITRLQYNYPASEPNTAKNRITARAPIQITATDLSNNPGKRFAATMFMAPSTAFAPGVTPTISQMLALGSGLIVTRSSSTYSTTGFKSFTIRGPLSGQMSPNTKYWVLVMPTVVNPTTTPSAANDKVPVGNTASTIGRGISMWTNRTPRKPTITSPQNGSVLDPEDYVALSFTSDDPDNMTGFAASANNKDIAGVEVQYANRPTAEEPNPGWRGLHTYYGDERGASGWNIIGSTDPNQSVDLANLRINQTIQMQVGVDGAENHNEASIPAGDWQIRLRTFDFGHPDPLFYNPLMNASGSYTATSYPAANTSPWSNPVFISIPTRVPPPVPISPRDAIAIAEDNPVVLKWRYRNTATPPLPQAFRLVEIREVGATDWTVVARDLSSSTEVDLSQWGTLDTATKTWDWESAGAGVDGWEFNDTPIGGETLVRSTAEHHTGVASLRAFETEGLGVTCDMSAYFTPGQITAIEFWVKNTDTAPLALWWLAFYDLDDDLIGFVGETYIQTTGNWDKVVATLQVPVNAVRVQFTTYPGDGHALYIDDFKIGTVAPFLETMHATTQYEWRVLTTDAEGAMSGDFSNASNFSQIARFWIVDAPASGDVRPAPLSTIDGATLGCGKHHAYVYRRGGLTRVGEIRNISYLDWGRVRDDISTSKIVVNDWDIDCGNLLANLQTWAYEIVIFRDNGQSVDRVWEGPITLLTYEIDAVTIHAKDVMGYAYRRIIKQAMVDSGTGNGDTVVNRAKRVLQNVFAPDDPNILSYLEVIANADDPMEYRSTPAYSRTAFEEVDDMAANAGLDYTAVGRSIVLWSTRHRIGLLPTFRDEDLGNSPIVSEYGMSMANRYAVSDGNGLWGEATRLNDQGEDPTYGLVEMVSSSWASDSADDVDTYTQAGAQTIRESFAAFAERSIADRYPPPVIVRIPDNTTLNPDAPISIQQLVPGVIIPLRSTSTLRTVVGNQKLDSVKVVDQADGETISITLSPFNHDDGSVESETEE